jgi:hypothetical protein
LSQRLKTIKRGNHIIAIYDKVEDKFDEAFSFLKDGLDKNEVIVITTADLSKDKIRDRIREEWEIDPIGLEPKGELIIRTAEEVYFPDGMPNIQRTKALWATLVENCLANGKKGMRVFGDMSAFFKEGFTKELIEYESSLEQSFRFPVIGICAYDSNDLVSNLTRVEVNHIKQCHGVTWLGQIKS